MGVQDRDWYWQHLKSTDATRKATYAPKAFRRAASSSHPPRRAPRNSSRRPLLASIVFWIVVTAIGFVGSHLLLHRTTAPTAANAIPVGVSSGRLRIVVEATSKARWIEFRQLGNNDQPNGILWKLPVVAGTTLDRDIPVGRYRISVTHQRGWMPAVSSELPTVLEFRDAGGQTAGGTLRI